MLKFLERRKALGVPLEYVSVTFHPDRIYPPKEILPLKKLVKHLKYEVDDEGPTWPFVHPVLGTT